MQAEQIDRQTSRRTNRRADGQTDIQRNATHTRTHNLHVKLISFNLNAIWRRFTCCVPRLLRSKCTRVSGRYFVAGTGTAGTCLVAPPSLADLALMMQCAIYARVLTARFIFMIFMIHNILINGPCGQSFCRFSSKTARRTWTLLNLKGINGVWKEKYRGK